MMICHLADHQFFLFILKRLFDQNEKTIPQLKNRFYMTNLFNLFLLLYDNHHKYPGLDYIDSFLQEV